MVIKRLPPTGDAPRSTGIPDSVAPGGSADSAGFPWAGRDFDHHGTEFANDDGSTPEALRLAVESVRAAAAAGEVAELASAIGEAVRVLSTVRVLVPLVTEAGELGLTPEGRTVEKTQELAVVTLTAPDGRRVMPVFSSVETMRRWNPEARPIPVPGPQAALAAAQEGTDLIVVDPCTREQEFGVRRTQLEAMALGEHRIPSWADPLVLAAIRESMADDPRVVAVGLEPGDPEARLLGAETEVIVELASGLGRDELAEVIARAQQRWAASDIVAARVDSLRVRPRASTATEG